MEDVQSDDDVDRVRCLALHSIEQVIDEFWEDKARYLSTLFFEVKYTPWDLIVCPELACSKSERCKNSRASNFNKQTDTYEVSRTEIKSLPNSLSMLYHLQTLRARKCPYLCELPNGMKNMISLRHLYYKNCNEDFQMPFDMGQLTCLQTLQFFNVGKEKGRKIEELGLLKNLRGK